NSLGIIQTPSGNSEFDIATNIPNPTTVYTLMNSAWGSFGADIATLEFKGAHGADASFDLVEGVNIRDHFNGGFNNTIAPGTPSANFGSDRLDEQTFVLPSSFANDTLKEIILTGHGGFPQGAAFLAGLTVATASGPSALVLLGSGVAPDVASSATVTVVSG